MAEWSFLTNHAQALQPCSLVEVMVNKCPVGCENTVADAELST